MSPTSREAAALEKASAVSGRSESHGAIIKTMRKRIGETNTEFESGTSPPYDEDEHPNLTRVQLRSATPLKQQALMPNTNDYRDCELWLYKDRLGCVHGPFSGARMASWFASGCFRMSLPVKRTCDREFQLLGQLIKTLGRLPFSHQTSPDQHCSAEKQMVTAGTTPPALPSDCSPAKEKPPLGCDDKILKESQISFVDLKEKPRPMITIKALPMTAARHPKCPPAAFVRSAERAKVPLGFRDAAELPAEDKRTKDGTKGEVNQHEGAWGGYKECQAAARSFVTAAVTQPAEAKTAANRRSTAATTTAPMTWAKVCQKTPTKPQWEEPAKQEPVAIENMARFPSLGGKAFTDAVQNKIKNQQQSQQYAWARRIAADQDFTRWSYDRLRKLPSYVHVPTFFELLRDVDSNAEIEEYVRMHLGNGEEVSRFAQEFVQRRSQWKQLTGWKSPAELRAATVRVDMASKGRKKTQKLNGTALGFVTAGEAFKKV
ncbi:uncharacterized protein LOC142579312 [Dermacentor variabilis]|uniref:uncharacterized protein LOC142579312 n=1 Tax=Dermacentor variabilis TaxID=34621 RepID=UPI003F5C21EC